MDAIKAFIKAQGEMGAAIKNASNPHLKSKYADLGSVMEAAMPALHANGFAIMQPSGGDERGLYVETILLHESGETFTSRIYLVMGKQDMQALGSAQTYARRYGLMGMAGVVPDDDDGEATKRPPAQQQPKPQQQQSQQPKQAPEPPLYQRLLDGLKEFGMRAANDPRFTADLEALRKDRPDLAAHVDVEIGKLREAAA